MFTFHRPTVIPRGVGVLSTLAERAELDCAHWIETRHADAAATDAVAETVNYSEVWELARACTAEREFRLVETLAHSIGCAIVERFGRVEAATVRVTKPAALASRGAAGAGAQLTVRRSGT